MYATLSYTVDSRVLLLAGLLRWPAHRAVTCRREHLAESCDGYAGATRKKSVMAWYRDALRRRRHQMIQATTRRAGSGASRVAMDRGAPRKDARHFKLDERCPSGLIHRVRDVSGRAYHGAGTAWHGAFFASSPRKLVYGVPLELRQRPGDWRLTSVVIERRRAEHASARQGFMSKHGRSPPADQTSDSSPPLT